MGWPFEDSRDYQTTADQRRCPPFSDVRGGIRKTRTSAKNGKGEPRTHGTVRQSRCDHDPTLKMVHWVPDDTLNCPECGPRVRRQRALAYYEKIGDPLLFEEVIAKDAWSSRSRRYRRHGVGYFQIGAADGQHRVVLSTVGPGRPIKDNRARLLELWAEAPAKAGMNASASDGWRIHEPKPAATPTPAAAGPPVDPVASPQTSLTDLEPAGYTFEAMVTAGLEHARETAQDLGIYVGEVAGRGGNAFLIRQPDDPLTWRRWCRWAGVQAPKGRTRRRKRRLEAA